MINIVVLFLILVSGPLIAQYSISSTPNSSAGQCDGTITVDLGNTTGPYEVELLLIDSEAGTSQSLETRINVSGVIAFGGLCIGEYFVIVLDDFGCRNETLMAGIVECNGISLSQPSQNFVTHSSNCSSPNGSISLVHGGPFNGNGPFSWVWFNGNTNTGIVDMLNPGTYTLTVTDSEGCTEDFSFNVQGTESTLLFELVFPSCENGSNGSIEIAPVPSNFPNPVPGIDDYTYAWSNGASSNIVDDLAPGTYTVTVTFIASGCSTIGTYEVDQVASSGPLTLNGSITEACNGNDSGRINLTVNGGTQPYSYKWNDESSREDRRDLAVGNYCVTVTDYCDEALSACYDIIERDMTLDLEAISGCENTGIVTAMVDQNEGPFNYNWNTGGSTQTLDNLASGEYCVVVHDGRGCEAFQCVELINRDIEIVETAACDMLHNGEIEITITNPENETVEVFLGGDQPLGVMSTSSRIVEVVENLPPATPFELLTEIGDCNIVEEFELEEIETEKVLFTFNVEEERCTWNEMCNGLLSGIATVETAMRFNTGDYGWCNAPAFCEDVDIDEKKKYPKRWLRAFEYEQLLNALSGGTPLYPADLVADRRARFNSLNEPDCGWVRYCTISLNIGFTGLGVDTDQGIIANGNCYQVDCAIDPYEFCLEGILPEVITDPVVTELRNCRIRNYNLGILTTWHDQMLIDFPNYAGSPLFGLVLQAKQDMQTWGRTDPYCSWVTFCKSDFSIKSHDYSFAPHLDPCILIQPFSCGPSSCWIQTCEPIDNGNGLITVYCDIPDGDVHTYKYDYGLNTIYPGIDLFSPPSPPQDGLKSINNPTILNIDGQSEDSHFADFSFLYSENNKKPDGLFVSNNTNKLYPFSFGNTKYSTMVLPNTIKYIKEFKTDNSATIRENLGYKEYQFLCEDKENVWSEILSSSEHIEILHLTSLDNFYFISGTFSENISFGGLELFNAANVSGAFLLKLDNTGTLLETQIIENVSIPETFFTTTNNAIYLSSVVRNNTIFVNGVAELSSTTSNQQFSQQLYSVSGMSSINQGFTITGQTELQHAVYSNGNTHSLIFKGAGSVAIGSSDPIELTVSDIAVVSLNEHNVLTWYKTFSAINDAAFSATLAFDDALNVFVGVNHSQTLSLKPNNYPVVGGTDIDIFKLSGTHGGVIYNQSYGSLEDEEVSKMYWDSNILYFGGNLYNSSEPRNLGNILFTQTAGQKNRNLGFITYFQENLTSQSSTVESGNLENHFLSSNSEDFNNNFNLTAYPNPFNNRLTISFDIGSCNGSVEFALKNTLGQNVWSRHQDCSGVNTFMIQEEFRVLPNGIYYLSATLVNGETETVRLVKS